MISNVTFIQVKEKLAQNARSRVQTGGGETEEVPLDAIEELYARVVGRALQIRRKICGLGCVTRALVHA